MQCISIIFLQNIEESPKYFECEFTMLKFSDIFTYPGHHSKKTDSRTLIKTWRIWSYTITYLKEMLLEKAFEIVDLEVSMQNN